MTASLLSPRSHSYFIHCHLQINQLRYCFDSLFYTDPNEMIATNLTTEDKNKIFIKIKQVIIR